MLFSEIGAIPPRVTPKGHINMTTPNRPARSVLIRKCGGLYGEFLHYLRESLVPASVRMSMSADEYSGEFSELMPSLRRVFDDSLELALLGSSPSFGDKVRRIVNTFLRRRVSSGVYYSPSGFSWDFCDESVFPYVNDTGRAHFVALLLSSPALSQALCRLNASLLFLREASL